MLAGTKIRVLKKSVASKVKRPEDIPVTKEFEELVNIEDLRRGDYVLSWNEKTGRQTYSKVTDTYTKKTDEVYILTLQSGEKIETTWNHSFRVMKSERTANGEQRIAGKPSVILKPQTLQVSLYSAFGQSEEKPDAENSEWREARRLKKGDVLFDSTGRQLRIRDVSVEKRRETVYNFTVEGEHDYYVGEDAVLVHNENCKLFSAVRFSPDELASLSNSPMPATVPVENSDSLCMKTVSCYKMTIEVSDSDNSSSFAEYQLTKDKKVILADGTEINGIVYKSTGKPDMVFDERSKSFKRVYTDGGNQFVADYGKEIDGEKSLSINGKTLTHGSLVQMSGKDGKMAVIDKDDIGSFIKRNGITDAVVSTNGVNNTGSDAVGMLKAVTGVTGKKNAFHLYNDANVMEGIDPDTMLGKNGNRDKVTAQESLKSLIKSGAFETGGAIICHSAGGNTCGKAVIASERKIKADVYTFGGVHEMAGNRYTKTWTDVYNKGDYVAKGGGVNRGSLDAGKKPTRDGSITNPPNYFKEDRPSDKNYLLMVNDSPYKKLIREGNAPYKPNIRGWKTNELLQHNFQNSYLTAFKRLYPLRKANSQ